MGKMFFVQAEDGIRDLVRSRGLGDVYKRQVLHDPAAVRYPTQTEMESSSSSTSSFVNASELRPVSYTHLTLPTSDLV